MQAASESGIRGRNDLLSLLLTAPTCVLAIYASASACGIALVQLGDAGPSAGHPMRAHIVRTPQAGGRARPHTGCGGSYATGSAASH